MSNLFQRITEFLQLSHTIASCDLQAREREQGGSSESEGKGHVCFLLKGGGLENRVGVCRGNPEFKVKLFELLCRYRTAAFACSGLCFCEHVLIQKLSPEYKFLSDAFLYETAS